MSQGHKSTTVLVFALALALFAYACAVDRSNVTPEQAVTLDQIEQEQAAAEASGDEVAIAAAEAKMDAFEARVLRERGGPIVGTVAALSPALAPWAPFATLLLPLFGRRGRKLGASAVKNLVKARLPSFAVDLAKMIGAVHSTPETADVVNGKATVVPNPPGGPASIVS